MTETLSEKTANWKKYGSLASILGQVISISELENTPRKNWTIKTDRLVSILKQERNRLDRIERLNRKTDQ